MFKKNGILIILIIVTIAGITYSQTNTVYHLDRTIGFESDFPQSEWDIKRQSGRIIGAEPALFLDDTFIMGSRNVKRTLHAVNKYTAPLSLPVSEKLMHSPTIFSIVPDTDEKGHIAYCVGSFQEKTLYSVFHTADGRSFTPIITDQLPSHEIWEGLDKKDVPEHNNILNLNQFNGEAFTSYYSAFFKVREATDYPYRAIIIRSKPRPRQVMIIQSRDGLNWQTMPNQTQRDILGEANQPAYDPFHNRYLCYLRLWDPPSRIVSGWRKVLFSEATFGPDGITWSDDELVLEADPKDGPSTDIYFMQVTGYAGGYIGIPVMYHRPASLDPEMAGKFHCELAFSHDGRNWDRVCQGEPFLSTGPENSWDAGLVWMNCPPIVKSDSLYFYYTGRKYDHDEIKPRDHKVRTGLATLRTDGFVSMDAGEETGTLLTTLFWPKGKHLYINADANGGEIRVEVLQDYHYVELKKVEKYSDDIQGLFRAENCIPFTGNAINHKVAWKHDENFVDNFPKDWLDLGDSAKYSNKKKPFEKRAIALKFYLKNAKLYSFWFADDDTAPLENGRLEPVSK